MGGNTDSQFIPCTVEKADYENILLELLTLMHELGDDLSNQSSQEFFMLSLHFDVILFIDRHGYWKGNCDFER